MLTPNAVKCPDCRRPIAGERDEEGEIAAFSIPPSAARTFPSALPSGNDPRLLGEVRTLGWSWGGFFLPYFWLLGHGRVGVGLMLLLSLAIPLVWFLHIFLYPVVAIYLGLNGYELAWKSQPYHSVEQLVRKEREWSLWGVLYVLAFLAITIFSAIYFAAFLAEMWQEFEDMGI